MKRYGNNTTAVLADTFPEWYVGKQHVTAPFPVRHGMSKFEFFSSRLTFCLIAPEGYWDNVEHRQKFLLGFADMAGFDPMLVNNWHNKLSRLRACGVSVAIKLPSHSHLQKKGASLLDRYENTQQMLEDAFQVRTLT